MWEQALSAHAAALSYTAALAHLSVHFINPGPPPDQDKSPLSPLGLPSVRVSHSSDGPHDCPQGCRMTYVELDQSLRLTGWQRLGVKWGTPFQKALIFELNNTLYFGATDKCLACHRNTGWLLKVFWDCVMGELNLQCIVYNRVH